MPLTSTRFRRPRAEAGTSLLEVLLASLLLLVISVFILPLFSNSLNSTLSGGRSSELTTLAQQSLEMIGQRPLDHTDWNLTGDTCGTDACVKESNPDHWYWPSSAADRIGEEGWVDTDASAPFYWKRTLTVRKYSIADVSAGTVDVTGTKVDTLGHPNLFDSPLTSDSGASAFDVHFLEFRVNLVPDHDRTLAAGQQQQQITVSHLRAN